MFGQPKRNPLPVPWNLKYSMAKSLAKSRGEYWAFTPETWYDMWVESGVMHHRGGNVQSYCMTRKDPIEAWGPHNCIIVPRRMHLKKLAFENFNKHKKTNYQDKHGVKRWTDDE